MKRRSLQQIIPAGATPKTPGLRLGMRRGFLPGPFGHGLTFIATLAFVASFFGSRLFATLYPSTVIMTGDIHIHHFWYGIALISIAGWIAIAWRNERLSRLCALLYGLGAGFVGDEVGLLLTFGDYESELTYQFFIAAMSIIIIMTLLLRYRTVVLRDVLRLSFRERVALVAAFLAGFSAFLLFLPSDNLSLTIPVVFVGLSITALAYARQRRSSPATTTSV